MMQYNFQYLERNLMDLIAEEQAKLGYRREAVRLYYPLSSLCHLLDGPAEGKTGLQLNADEMQTALELFAESVADKFGNVKISHKNIRFCFLLPEEASDYVHEHQEESRFIYDLVSLIAAHGTTMEDIKEFFRSQEAECVIEDIGGEEFDTLIRFADSEDRYYYCFRDEIVHIIYHRFLPEDYHDLYD